MDPTAALNRLRISTESFLSEYFLAVATAASAGITQYYFGSFSQLDLSNNAVPARGDPRLGRKGKRHFRFESSAAQLYPDRVSVMAYHLPVTAANTVNLTRLPGVALARNGGPDLMLTTVINACTFAALGRTNDVLVQHLRPMGTDPVSLGNSMTGGAFFQGETNRATAFGPDHGYAYGPQDATVIGVRKGTRWKFYAQRHPRAQAVVSDVILVADL